MVKKKWEFGGISSVEIEVRRECVAILKVFLRFDRTDVSHSEWFKVYRAIDVCRDVHEILKELNEKLKSEEGYAMPYMPKGEQVRDKQPAFIEG